MFHGVNNTIITDANNPEVATLCPPNVAYTAANMATMPTKVVTRQP